MTDGIADRVEQSPQAFAVTYAIPPLRGIATATVYVAGDEYAAVASLSRRIGRHIHVCEVAQCPAGVTPRRLVFPRGLRGRISQAAIQQGATTESVVAMFANQGLTAEMLHGLRTATVVVQDGDVDTIQELPAGDPAATG